MWVHPIVAARYHKGAFRNLMVQLRQDDTKFFNYFRMSASSFDELLGLVQHDLQKQDTSFRQSISPEEKLAICLR